ncbi:alpha/beta hydrolase [Vibrio hannami]|nr:alpha/beta fold hydrolase [Vibrio hannami]MDG3087524.1 alpha/beta hydrolase [Vibrio hannami]
MITLVISMGCANSVFYSSPDKKTYGEGLQWLQSDSGNQLAFRWYKPENASKGIIVHFHGNSSDLDSASEKVSWLKNYGYDVFVFDYSGFGYSAGKAKDYILHQDALSVLGYVDNVRKQQQKPVYVISTSTGANVFLRAWIEHPLPVDGVLLDSAYSSYIDIASYTLKQSSTGFLYAWLSPLFIRDKYSISSIDTPLPSSHFLIAHCIEDRVVSVNYSRDIFNAVSGNKQLLLLSGCRHAQAFTNKHPEYQDKLIHWLKNIEFRKY